MITKLRKRYYCEHCGKGGGSAGHMRRHERTCTANPTRECEMCQHTEAGHHELSMTALVAMLPKRADFAHEITEPDLGTWVDYPGLDDAIKDALPALRERVGDCPACLLATFRQADLCDQISSDTFDYKREKRVLWDCVNEANRY